MQISSSDVEYIKKQIARARSASNHHVLTDCYWRIASNQGITRPDQTELEPGDTQRVTRFINQFEAKYGR